MNREPESHLLLPADRSQTESTISQVPGPSGECFYFKPLLRLRLFGLVLIAFVSLILQQPGWAQEIYSVAHGPIELRDQHPLSLLHTTFRPEDASIPPPGTLRFGMNYSWSNTLNYKPEEFRVDAETRIADFFFRYGLTDGLELQFSQNIIWRGSGVSDRLIQDFHDTFQIEQGSSAEVPSDEYEISGTNSNGSKFKLGRSGTGLSGLEAALKYSPSNQFAEEKWALLAGIGLPTGTAEFTQDGLDLQLALYGQAGFDRIEFYSGAAILYYSDTEINSLKFPSFQYAGFVGVQLPTDSAYSFYSGLHLASILLEDVSGYPDYQTYIDIGLRTRLSTALVFDAAIRENILHSQGTTDITLMAGLSYQAWP